MPRGPRLDAPGTVHHVIVRRIERRQIFQSDRDREDFLDRLGKVVQEGEASCFAWVLIPNHVHLLLRTGPTPFARLMRRLLTGYAISFNLCYQRAETGDQSGPFGFLLCVIKEIGNDGEAVVGDASNDSCRCSLCIIEGRDICKR